MENENPSYYAILTADVRYSNCINANEKLLFAEITSLSNTSGICWASNAYFAHLFNCTPQAISKWIKNLEKHNFIMCEYTYRQGTKEVEKRLIRCINNDIKGINSDIKGINTRLGGYQHTIKENNKIINNKENTKGGDSQLVKEHINYDQIREVYNFYADKNSLSRLRTFTDKRKKKLLVRLKENKEFKSILNEALKKISESSFLTGLNDRRWKVDFDWLIENDTNAIKICEDKYKDKDNGEWR